MSKVKLTFHQNFTVCCLIDLSDQPSVINERGRERTGNDVEVKAGYFKHNSKLFHLIYVLFSKRAGVFYRVIKPRGEAEWFYNPIKHDPRVF